MGVRRREHGWNAEETSGTRELWTFAPALATCTPEPRPPAIEQDVAEDRPPLNRAFARLRARLRRSPDPFTLGALEVPSRPEIPRIRRGQIEAWWSARRTSLDVDEFLRERLRRYLGQCGVASERLPLSIGVASGRITVTTRGGRPAAGDWLARYLRENGEAALGADIALARTEAARADAALDEVRERLAQARRDLDTAARAPSLSEQDGATPYGRPAVPPPWGVAIHGFVGAMVLVDAWQFAVPLLRRAGIAPADTIAESSRRPGAVALAVLLALGASAAIFVFSAEGVRRARALLDLLPIRWNVGLHVVAGATALLMAGGLTWALIGLGAAGAAALPVMPFLIAMALPLATPPWLAVARRLHAARAVASRAAAEWDHAHQAAVALWTRTSAIVSATDRERAALEARRASWTQHLHRLRMRVAEVSRVAAEATDAEASELRETAHAIVAALELDRSAYLRRGNAASRALPVVDLDVRAGAPDSTAGAPSRSRAS